MLSIDWHCNELTLRYEILPARRKDIPYLASIEPEAARLFVGHAPECTLNETTSRVEFMEAQKSGRLFVALTNDAPVGFAHVEILEPTVAYLKEIDVHPKHGRRGLGRRLVMAVCA